MTNLEKRDDLEERVRQFHMPGSSITKSRTPVDTVRLVIDLWAEVQRLRVRLKETRDLYQR